MHWCAKPPPGDPSSGLVPLDLSEGKYLWRPVFQTCICVERYMAVVQPVAFIKYKLKRYRPGPGEVEGGRGGEKKQGTTDPQKMRAFSIVLTNLVIIVVSSISVVVSFVTLSFINLDFNCKTFPILLMSNMLSVVASPVLHLHREGRLHCRKRPETH
ncbi:hypothetical protein DPEC_G00184580 [Dallia pectoralis]|uniref:Uncharacterized protein n=1 Tax=Dallia pectoralis TaxID=75939 RepID=A0ACC2GB31_DALPE|nr:hypothetical protein DPEC_G00184580 [Dallia pectoralis]